MILWEVRDIDCDKLIKNTLSCSESPLFCARLPRIYRFWTEKLQRLIQLKILVNSKFIREEFINDFAIFTNYISDPIRYLCESHILHSLSFSWQPRFWTYPNRVWLQSICGLVLSMVCFLILVGINWKKSILIFSDWPGSNFRRGFSFC